MANSGLPQKILVIDKDQAVLNQITGICAKRSINTLTALTYENALYHFNNNKFDLAIVSLQLEEASGLVLVQRFRNHEMATKRDIGVLISIGGSTQAGDNGLLTELKNALWLQKPIKEPALLSAMAKMMAQLAQNDQFNEVMSKLVQPLLKKGDVEGLKALSRGKLLEMGQRGHELAAHVEEQIKELGQAKSVYSGLHEKVPQNMRYINEIARLSMQMGDFAAAEQYFAKADATAPQNIARLRQMATNYLHLGKPDESVAKFKQIIDADPGAESEKYDMFAELQEFGYEEHAQQLCAATTTPLELIRHFNNKGVMFSKSEDYVSAIDEYKKAQKLIPQSKELYRILYNEALAHINLKAPNHLIEAEELLQQCMKVKPSFQKAEEKLQWLKKRGMKKSS